MRTRAENAARKGLRILNERKRVKAARTAGEPVAPSPPALVTGERFGKLVALERGEDYVRGNARQDRWWFACDCGARVLWKPSTARSNWRDLGWCSCPDCYRAAGGWEAIKARRLTRGAR